MMDDKKIFSVLELNQKIKSLVESDFSFIGILVKGEITSLNRHYTGHYYFKLRGEDGALLSCIMFSSYTKYAPLDLKNGDEVLVTGSISFYDKGGTYSFSARKIEPYGYGAYLLDLKRLEEKLEKEGLFSKEKKVIPLLPRKIGIITAKSGAAIHDVVSSIQKRCKTEIYIFPCSVQGNEAPKTMVEALKRAYSFSLDLIILTRGGGSKDDLYAFNDEELVRTLALSPFPTITAVGHSIDTSLVDRISDLSCITSTDAGNHAIASKEELEKTIEHLCSKAKDCYERRVKDRQNIVLQCIHRMELYSPKRKMEQFKLRLDYLKKESQQLISKKIMQNRLLLKNLSVGNSILKRIESFKNQVKDFYEKSKKACFLSLKEKRKNLLILKNRMETFSPFSLLSKGYTMMYNEKGKIITSGKEVHEEEMFYLKLSDADIQAKIIKIEERKNDGKEKL